jgi:hypothetical protein
MSRSASRPATVVASSSSARECGRSPLQNDSVPTTRLAARMGTVSA